MEKCENCKFWLALRLRQEASRLGFDPKKPVDTRIATKMLELAKRKENFQYD